MYYNTLQEVIDATWRYLLSSYVFNSVYFETWWTTVCYAVLLAGPYVMDLVPWCHQYRIDPNMRWRSVTLWTILVEAVTYCTPLMTLDTLMVKKYPGVEPTEWQRRRHSWIQYTRALPPDPPSLISIILQLLGSLIIYDAVFFCIHYSLHRSKWLHKHVHKVHHDHEVIYGRVTNQLSVTERIMLVLTANEALKLVGGHPLTRAIFVPVFVAWLVDNHSGYDLPLGLDKLVPWGLVGGSRHHHEHHVHGTRHYQPFFTYLDALLDHNVKHKPS